MTQLFDLLDDPCETRDLSGDSEHTDVQARLTDLLIENMYGGDMEWVDGGKLKGTPDPNPEFDESHAQPVLRKPARDTASDTKGRLRICHREYRPELVTIGKRYATYGGRACRTGQTYC